MGRGSPSGADLGQWGPFRLLGVLHEGRLARCFVATREGGSRVSLKVLQPFADVRVQRRGLLREAELQARCAHPAIVRILDAAEIECGAYIAREFVEGRTLAELRQAVEAGQERVSLERLREIGARLLDALAHVHGQSGTEGKRLGLVHRDVTPANVLLGEDGSVRLTDFGLAHARRLHAPLAEDELSQGTRRFLPPEVLGGVAPDARADLYQLAATLKELYRAQSWDDARSAAAIESVLERALQRDPDERFATAEEMAAAWARI